MGSKLSLAEFVRAMKKYRRKQVGGFLFFLDKQTDEVCGCALGQGLLESGLVDPDEIKAQLKKGRFVASVPVWDAATGKEQEQRPGYINDSLEITYMNKLNVLYGSEFTSLVAATNDSYHKPLPSIIDKIFEKFGNRL